MSTIDAGLVRAARDGDATSLGLLLERYRPSLLAHALRLLGGRSTEAHDAVQETCVVALCKLHTVREPAAVGGWLHAVLHNACAMAQRRDSHECPSDDISEFTDRTVWGSVEEELDRLALRSWIWAGIDELTEPLALPLILRYFSRATSYEQIAAICGVPVGTVRSRLNEGKRKLAEALLREAAASGIAERRAGEALTREFEEAIDQLARDQDPSGLIEGCAPDVAIQLGTGPAVYGREHIVAGAELDAAAGVSYQLTNVLASDRLVVAEGRFLNPPDDPYHCPAGVVQVHHRPDGWTRRLVVHYTELE